MQSGQHDLWGRPAQAQSFAAATKASPSGPWPRPAITGVGAELPAPMVSDPASPARFGARFRVAFGQNEHRIDDLTHRKTGRLGALRAKVEERAAPTEGPVKPTAFDQRMLHQRLTHLAAVLHDEGKDTVKCQFPEPRHGSLSATISLPCRGWAEWAFDDTGHPPPAPPRCPPPAVENASGKNVDAPKTATGQWGVGSCGCRGGHRLAILAGLRVHADG